jgi:hypothetical protein
VLFGLELESDAQIEKDAGRGHIVYEATTVVIHRHVLVAECAIQLPCQVRTDAEAANVCLGRGVNLVGEVVVATDAYKGIYTVFSA